MSLYDFAVQLDCGCTFFCIKEVEAIDYFYCPKHEAAPKMYDVLDRVIQEVQNTGSISAGTIRAVTAILALADGDKEGE